MTKPWLDLTPADASRDQLKRADRLLVGTVVDILGDGTVEVLIDGSEEPNVIAPVQAGVTAIGASVQLIRDSSGRVIQVASPHTLPPEAEAVAIGATGQWLEGLRAANERVEAAQAELAQAAMDRQAAMEDLASDLAAAELDQADVLDQLADLNENILPELNEQLEGLGELGDVQAVLDGLQETKATVEDLAAAVGGMGYVTTSGPPPPDPVIGKSLWISPQGYVYTAVECEESA